MPALIVLVVTMWGFFIHANVRWRLGPLEWLISTPAFHHWHHTLAEPRDRNYASMLPWMDWIFGTYYLPGNSGRRPTASMRSCPGRWADNWCIRCARPRLEILPHVGGSRLVGRAVEDDAALVHDHRAIGDPQRRGDVLLDQDRRHAVRLAHLAHLRE